MVDAASPSRPSDPANRAPLVGRERELAQLRADLEMGLAGEGRLLLLTGEPGIGKTRTAEAWRRWPSREMPWSCGGAATRPSGLRRTGRGCRSSAAMRNSDPGGVAQRSRRRRRRCRSPRAGHRARGCVSLAGTPLAGARASAVPAFDHIAAFLRRAATGQPLILILDDLHWADAPSLLLLEFVAREGAMSRS